MLGTLNLKLIAIVVAVLTTFFAGWTVNGWRYEKRIAQEKIAQEKVIQAKEAEHQAEADKIRKDKNAQIDAINNQLFSALSELRNRPSRASQSTVNGQVTCGNTGASLSAEDSEFLEREASRADQIRVALEACYAQYDEVTK